jgi:hypothetical protein
MFCFMLFLPGFPTILFLRLPLPANPLSYKIGCGLHTPCYFIPHQMGYGCCAKPVSASKV